MGEQNPKEELVDQFLMISHFLLMTCAVFLWSGLRQF